MELAGIPVGELIAVQICAVYDKQYEFYDRPIASFSTNAIEIAIDSKFPFFHWFFHFRIYFFYHLDLGP